MFCTGHLFWLTPQSSILYNARGSFSGRELWVRWPLGEGSQFAPLAQRELSRRVHVGLAEDDHPDVRVEVDLARAGAGEPGSKDGEVGELP